MTLGFYVQKEHRWTHGLPAYALLCSSLAALYALPAEYKGIGAAGVFLVIAVTPALGKRGKR